MNLIIYGLLRGFPCGPRLQAIKFSDHTLPEKLKPISGFERTHELVGLRIKNEIKRLSCSLVYMVAMCLCPAMRKQDARGDKRVSPYREPQIGEADSIAVKNHPATEGAVKGAFAIFGKVINSIPVSFQCIRVADVFIYRFNYQDNVQEFGAMPSEERKTSAVRYVRKAEGSVKRGFDLLRLTLNLARGDLEAATPRPLVAR